MTCTLAQHYAHLPLGITTMKIQPHLPINLPFWTIQSAKNPPTFQPSIIANNAIAGLLHICRDFRRHLRYEVCKVDESVSAFGEKIIALIEFSKECLSYSLQYYHKNFFPVIYILQRGGRRWGYFQYPQASVQFCTVFPNPTFRISNYSKPIKIAHNIFGYLFTFKDRQVCTHQTALVSA